MAPLTQSEVDSLVAELGPHIGSKDQRVQLGLAVYRKLFDAHPEYIQYFSKLGGMNKDAVFQSDNIKYYAGTLVDDLVEMLKHAANDGELKRLLDKSGKDHTTRKINKQQFMSGEAIFVNYFNSALSNGANKAAMEKFLKHVFPAIASHL